jgi:hypothetical protein
MGSVTDVRPYGEASKAQPKLTHIFVWLIITNFAIHIDKQAERTTPPYRRRSQENTRKWPIDPATPLWTSYCAMSETPDWEAGGLTPWKGTPRRLTCMAEYRRREHQHVRDRI